MLHETKGFPGVIIRKVTANCVRIDNVRALFDQGCGINGNGVNILVGEVRKRVFL